MSKNPYQVLNISQDATYQQIKDSYLHLTRNLHPDKQPIQNYHMAKQHFQKIDKAYKSISTPLRRFVFKQFGLKAISLMDNFPFEFKHFQEDGVDLDNLQQQKKIRTLIIYMLHEEHAMNETDKSKFNTKSIINMSKTLNKSKFSTGRRIPQIQKNSFQYEMPLPDYYGFSNSFAISQDASGLQKSINSSMDFTFATMKRIRTNILLHGQANINNNQTSYEMNADWIINNSMQIRFSPLSVSNGEFALPKIGVDKVFRNFAFSAITDFNHINIDLSDSNQSEKPKKLNKSIKIMMEKNALMLMPKIQYDLTKDVKIIVQLMASLQEQNTLNFGFNYGYKLKLNQQYKLELMSFTGAQNFLQVSLYSPKFRVSLPLISEGDAVTLETYKVAVFLSSFLIIKIVEYMSRQNKNLRKKIIQQQYNRLSEQKLLLTKINNQYSVAAQQRLQKELKYNGLVIVKTFIGDYKKIHSLYNLFRNLSNLNKQILKSRKNQQIYEPLKQSIQQLIISEKVQFGEIEHQLYEITQLFRSYVKGGQIINKKVQDFHILLHQEAIPFILSIYLNNGQIGIYFADNKQHVNIGGLNQTKAPIFKRIKTLIVDYLW